MAKCWVPRGALQFFLVGKHMKGESKERWRELCERAANEQDPDLLVELAAEIDRLLEEKEARLRPDNSAQQSIDSARSDSVTDDPLKSD